MKCQIALALVESDKLIWNEIAFRVVKNRCIVLAYMLRLVICKVSICTDDTTGSRIWNYNDKIMNCVLGKSYVVFY
jgi:hypothetical protein